MITVPRWWNYQPLDCQNKISLGLRDCEISKGCLKVQERYQITLSTFGIVGEFCRAAPQSIVKSHSGAVLNLLFCSMVLFGNIYNT